MRMSAKVEVKVILFRSRPEQVFAGNRELLAILESEPDSLTQ